MHSNGGPFGIVGRTVRRYLVGVALAVASATGHSQQPLETETARLPRHGEITVNGAYEFQTSNEGSEHAFPLAIEYGLTDRLALLVEPVFLTAIRPKAGGGATGQGDLEVTGQYLLWKETPRIPALALAAEEKFPTATNPRIGTQRADFTPFLIVSKRLGTLDAHVNVGYSFMGKPAGLQVQNTLNLAFAIEQHVTPQVDLMAEILSASASIAGGEGTVDPNAPELAGAEQVGMVGVRYRYRPHTWLSLGVTYDNSNAVLLRPGVSIVLP
jgi:hypothetical protein